MKRTWISAAFLVLAGMALAQPPVDYELYCGEGDEAPLIGVASVTADHVHVALLAGATCDDIVVAPEAGFTVAIAADALGDATVTVAFDDPEVDAEVTVNQVPQVALDGMLGAHKLRAAAMERAAWGQARSEERSAGRPLDVDDAENEPEGEDAGPPAEAGRPADLPAGAGRGRP